MGREHVRKKLNEDAAAEPVVAHALSLAEQLMPRHQARLAGELLNLCGINRTNARAVYDRLDPDARETLVGFFSLWIDKDEGEQPPSEA